MEKLFSFRNIKQNIHVNGVLKIYLGCSHFKGIDGKGTICMSKAVFQKQISTYFGFFLQITNNAKKFIYPFTGNLMTSQ